MIEENEELSYRNRSQDIGFNTTISSPKIHAITLKTLIDHLKPGGKALDIGCGSGYFTTCMALTMGEGSEVFAIDHIEELCDFALCNIMKNHSELFETDQLTFVTKDGSTGLEENGPYDVIHVGAAPE
jgi:protein-L-isoaspartate(D-aspartate) O-methyltransferase